MSSRQQPVRFECEGDALCGVLHLSEEGIEQGVLMVVGGPQYRVGSHRQNVLLARGLASAGVNVMRFDPRGMGDSEGALRSFRDMESDIHGAVGEFLRQVPTVSKVVIWGLCDGASAALLAAQTDPRVVGLVLVNPWMHSQEALARSYLKHYYRPRLFEGSFWRKLLSGHFEFRKSLSSLIGTLAPLAGAHRTEPAALERSEDSHDPSLESDMARALENFAGKVLVILSGNDLTAAEFKDSVARSPRWRKLMDQTRVSRHDLPDADHTFSRRDWRNQVAEWTIDWIYSQTTHSPVEHGPGDSATPALRPVADG